MIWQLPQTLEQIGDGQIRHIHNIDPVCESLQLLLDEGLPLFVEIRYAPYHNHVLCAGLEPQRYLKCLSRGHVILDACKIGI